MHSSSSGIGRNLAHCRFVFAVAALLVLAWPAFGLRAQEEKAPVAAPGDALSTPGPFATSFTQADAPRPGEVDEGCCRLAAGPHPR